MLALSPKLSVRCGREAPAFLGRLCFGLPGARAGLPASLWSPTASAGSIGDGLPIWMRRGTAEGEWDTGIIPKAVDCVDSPAWCASSSSARSLEAMRRRQQNRSCPPHGMTHGTPPRPKADQ